MFFIKYHALGNDYIVLNPEDYPDWKAAPSPVQIRTVCHRNFGVGSDGILWGPLPSKTSQFGLRIFNPDGSEAEKSGNGLRIFSRYLYDRKLAPSDGREFTIETPGGQVTSAVRDAGRMITVAMGSVSFRSDRVPVRLEEIGGYAREVINEKLRGVADRDFLFCAATIGNPHCVLPLAEAEVTPEFAKYYGPHVETHPAFPKKTNVQFLHVINRSNIRIEIWERGAGYTLASGSSSSAAAAVAHRLGLAGRHVTVHMPGGEIDIEIGEKYEIQMTGPVTRVAEGKMDAEMFGVKLP
jgi:diaminopimelate epimerase